MYWLLTLIHWDGDPIAAARKLGGIVDSANVTETGQCVCEILYDDTF
jgi:hypothetical protein